MRNLRKVLTATSVGAASCGLVLLGLAVTARADLVDFYLSPPIPSGSASYAGGSAPLIIGGTGGNPGVDVSGVAEHPFDVLGQPLTGACAGEACLNAITGPSIGSWMWGPNHSSIAVTIVGGDPSASIPNGTTLMEGQIVGAVLEQVVPGSFAVDITFSIDTINAALLAALNSPTPGSSDWFGQMNLSIAFNTPTLTGSPFIASQANTFSGDYLNSPTPEPASFALVALGIGLIGIAALKRRNDLGDTPLY